MSDPFGKLNEMVDELNGVLNKYGLQVDSLVGQFKHPIELDVHIEEKKNE